MDKAWSKIKQAFEARLAPELKSRLQVHVAGYVSGGRCWLVFDGLEVVSVESPGFIRWILGHRVCADLVLGQTVELGRACGELPLLSIDAALGSVNPLIRGLAILDARCGKRRLALLRSQPLDSFSAVMLAVRLVSLGAIPSPVVCGQCGQVLTFPGQWLKPGLTGR